MTVSVANKLVELRKKNGLSQEELASRLGLSRQAISKWERAEASPDTDNLIQLARLYGVSLDALLLDGDLEPDSLCREAPTVRESPTAGEIKTLLQSEDRDELVFVFDKNEEDGDTGLGDSPKFMMRIFSALIVVVYLLFGVFVDMWHPGWLLFFLIPIVDSGIKAVARKDPHSFAFPILAVAFYLFMGFVWEIWHPTWVVFPLIPVYYAVLPSKKKKRL